METQFTPGPWGVFLDVDENQFQVFQDEGRGYGKLLARVVGTRGSFEANARLIAAAPTLYAACEAAYNALRSYQYGNSASDLAAEVADILDAAMAKARGE